MDIKMERAIIRTFKKMREEGYLGRSELSGIFINFCYAEYGVHSGLYTKDIWIYQNTEIWVITFPTLGSYKPEISNIVYGALADISLSEFYSLWLRASWENPKEENWGHPVVRQAFRDYNQISSLLPIFNPDSKEETNDPVDVNIFLKNYSPLFLEQKHELFVSSEMKAKLDEIEKMMSIKVVNF